jgi:hypothetical protein
MKLEGFRPRRVTDSQDAVRKISVDRKLPGPAHSCGPVRLRRIFLWRSFGQ